MKTIYAIAALAALSGCSEWTTEQNKLAAIVVLDYVQTLDLSGPLDPADQAKLQLVCDLSAIQYPEYADTIALACASVEVEE